MTSTVVNDTLHFITSLKLKELEKQQTAYQQHIRVLDDVRSCLDGGSAGTTGVFGRDKSSVIVSQESMASTTLSEASKQLSLCS